MQAKLPDINAAIVRHRSNALTCLERGNYSGCIISLSAINALFPEEFKVEVNTEKYNLLSSEKKTISCDFCTEKPFLKNIRVYELMQIAINSFVSGNEYEKVWDCPFCKKTNKFKHENIKIIKFQEPSYFKVMPSPPTRKGIRNRKNFDYEYKKWFSIALDEIESQIGIYRAEYLAQQDSEGAPIIEDSEK